MEDLIWESVLNVFHGWDAVTELDRLSCYWQSIESKMLRQAEMSALVDWFHGISSHILAMLSLILCKLLLQRRDIFRGVS